MKRFFSTVTALTLIIGVLAIPSCSDETASTSSAPISSVNTSSAVVSISAPPSVVDTVEKKIEECAYGDSLSDLLGETENLMEDYFLNYSEISVTKGFDWDGTSRPELGKEVAPNLFDGDTATKWCCGDSEAEGCSAVVWSMKKAVTVTNYTFTTANDNAEYIGRNPVGWRLYATNNELNADMAMSDSMFSGNTVPEGWVLIDEVVQTQMPDENFVECGWAVDADKQASYSGYMLLIDDCDYTNEVFQMSEIDLYGTAE